MRDWLRQNHDDALISLAASDTLWCQVQRLRTVQVACVVLLPVCLSLAAQVWSDVALEAAYVGFGMGIADAVFINWLIVERRREAAQAQDRFDAISLGLARSEFRRMSDSDLSRLGDLARAQPTERRGRNPDWYTPQLGKLPQELGRIACMRESATWDATLRRRWANAVLFITLAIAAAFITWSVMAQQRADVILQSIAVPLSPALLWAIREYREQLDSSKAIAEIQARLRASWERYVAQPTGYAELSVVASEIAADFLEYRGMTSPVPNIFYSWLRQRQTTSAADAAAALLQEYQSGNARR